LDHNRSLTITISANIGWSKGKGEFGTDETQQVGTRKMADTKSAGCDCALRRENTRNGGQMH